MKKSYAVTINIDNEEIETQFIQATDLEDLKIRYNNGEGDTANRQMDWDYDVVEVHELSQLVTAKSIFKA